MVDRRLKNLRIDPELWHQAKIEAIKQNLTLQDFVAQALREKLGLVPCQTKTTNR